MKNKKIVSKIIATTLVCSSIFTTFNGSTVQAKTKQIEYINYSEIDSANKKMDKIIEKLNLYISSMKPENVTNEFISNFFKENISNSEELTSAEMQSIINFSNKQTNKLKAEGYSEEEILDRQLKKSIKVNDKITIDILNNGIFSIDKSYVEYNKAGQVRANVYGAAYKDYYSWVGVWVFTCAADASFSYNGSKATYRNGTANSYFKRGSLSIWQISNQSTQQGSRGTSAFSKISGNCHFGFEYQGVGLIIQDLFVVHEVSCNKSGQISTSMNAN